MWYGIMDHREKGFFCNRNLQSEKQGEKRGISRVIYTIEAAIWVPFYMMIVLIVIRLSIALYMEIYQDSGAEELCKLWCVEGFYCNEVAEDVWEGLQQYEKGA